MQNGRTRDETGEFQLSTNGHAGEPTRASTAAAAREHAYDQLRNKILVGELAPGATFSQVQLATELGVSRTPLREAVRLLQTEGLLRSEPKRRVRVAPLTTETSRTCMQCGSCSTASRCA